MRRVGRRRCTCIISTSINPPDIIRNIVYNFALIIKWNFFLLISSKKFPRRSTISKKTEQPRKEKENTFRSIDFLRFQPTVPRILIRISLFSIRIEQREIISSSTIENFRWGWGSRDEIRSEEEVSAKENFIGGAIGDYRPPTLGSRVGQWRKGGGSACNGRRLWACVYMPAALQSRGREKSKKSINRVEHCLHEA